MQLRLLGPADAQAFQQIRLDALRDTPSAFSSSYEEERDTPLAAVAEQLTPAPERFVVGAFEDGRSSASPGLHREEQAKLSHKAVLWGVYVAPEARSGHRAQAPRPRDRGGRVDAGLAQINLSVNSANAAALALYEGWDSLRSGSSAAICRWTASCTTRSTWAFVAVAAGKFRVRLRHARRMRRGHDCGTELTEEFP
jgi:ribosomal protein S18 acetylase RimI-like enzyme